MAALVFVLILGSIVGLAVARGFVLSYMWTWFIVPLGAHPINIAHAIGLSLLIGMFTAHLKSDDEAQTGKSAVEKLVGFFAKHIAQLIFAFFVGWLLSGMIG